MTELDQSPVTDPTDEACPHRGATDGVQITPAAPRVQAWTCAVCGLDFALAVIGLLPTPALRTAAFLDMLAHEVHRRSGKARTMPSPSVFPA